MNFEDKLITGLFIKRYKRFFVDIKVGSNIVTAHCPNTGSMMGLLKKDNKVWLTKSENPKRPRKVPRTPVSIFRTDLVMLSASVITRRPEMARNSSKRTLKNQSDQCYLDAFFFFTGPWPCPVRLCAAPADGLVRPGRGAAC